MLFSCQWTGIPQTSKEKQTKMRRLALATALACILSGVARAGEIHSTGVIAPPPPSTTTVAGEIPGGDRTMFGEIPSTDATTPQASSMALTIILTLLSFGR
jgi:hypothetical protein